MQGCILSKNCGLPLLPFLPSFTLVHGGLYHCKRLLRHLKNFLTRHDEIKQRSLESNWKYTRTVDQQLYDQQKRSSRDPRFCRMNTLVSNRKRRACYILCTGPFFLSSPDVRLCICSSHSCLQHSLLATKNGTAEISRNCVSSVLAVFSHSFCSFFNCKNKSEWRRGSLTRFDVVTHSLVTFDILIFWCFDVLIFWFCVKMSKVPFNNSVLSEIHFLLIWLRYAAVTMGAIALLCVER